MHKGLKKQKGGVEKVKEGKQRDLEADAATCFK